MESISSYYKRIIKALANSIFRAKEVNLIQLPKKIKEGSSCGNCQYWRDVNDELGYCSFSQVSLYVTQRQVCNNWAADGTIGKWDNRKIALEKDYGDTPPKPEVDIDTNPNGGVSYEGEEVTRAISAGLVSLPKNQKGAHCFNCEYSSSGGWCKKINVHIDKNDKCNKWTHPGTLRYKD